jgi:hypothetical protein
MFAKVRRMFHRDHLTISEILGGPVCRAIRSKPGSKKAIPVTTSILKDHRLRASSPYIPTLLLALEVDSRRAKRDRRAALMLFDAIKQEGMPVAIP